MKPHDFWNKLKFLFNSGKNPKWKYYLLSIIRQHYPKPLLRRKLKRTLDSINDRKDRQYILDRCGYYCGLPAKESGEASPFRAPLNELKVQKPRVYYYDTLRYTRWFPGNLNLKLFAGDVVTVPPVPGIVKSRPLTPYNSNSVLLNLDRVRHFIFVNDRKTWASKKDKVLFRGRSSSNEGRLRFMRRWFGHPLVDAGDVGRQPKDPAWKTRKLTLKEQLQYKFVMALEGNDVASNLKWIMSSNSIAVMPRPTCETWFMEGRLEPNVHYIEIKPDFSDLEEKINHYLSHPREAEIILHNAHDWVSQFRNRKREDLISLMVLSRYFDNANPGWRENI